MRRVLLALAAALGAGACLPDDSPQVVYDERFEDCVECRWSLLRGRYTTVETVHPAEHGLQFLEATTIATPLAITISDEFNDGHWIEYSTDCGGAPTVIVSSADVDAWNVEVVVPTGADGTPGEFERVYANLPPLLDPDPYDYDGPRLTSLILHAEPWAGPCVIDNLRVMLAAPDYGY